jgi:hypothetical protein
MHKLNFIPQFRKSAYVQLLSHSVQTYFEPYIQLFILCCCFNLAIVLLSKHLENYAVMVFGGQQPCSLKGGYVLSHQS